VAATLQEKIEQAFAGRAMPAELIDASVFQFDSDVEEALWFTGRDWRELRWKDWIEHSSALLFFSREAFAYYLPSLLRLSAQNLAEWSHAVDSLIGELDRSPSAEGWNEHFTRRFLGLRREELDALKEWLLCMCESHYYRGYGYAACGPGERFARAFDTVDLIQKELGRGESGGAQSTGDSDGPEWTKN
jgi:hypothetical protein